MDLRSIYFPASLQYIGSYAFSNCRYLDGITYDQNFNIYNIDTGIGIFSPYSDYEYGNEEYHDNLCNDLWNMLDSQYPNQYDDYKIAPAKEEMKKAEFKEANAVKMSLKGQTYNIEEWMSYLTATSDLFSGYPYDIYVPNGKKTISDKEFYQLAVSGVIIPESVTKIGNKAFSDSELSEIIIPDSVEYIGDEAFSKCYELYSINIPHSIKRIGHSAFSECSALQYVLLGSLSRNNDEQEE